MTLLAARAVTSRRDAFRRPVQVLKVPLGLRFVVGML
jgi:hypothetical protein